MDPRRRRPEHGPLRPADDDQAEGRGRPLLPGFEAGGSGRAGGRGRGRRGRRGLTPAVPAKAGTSGKPAETSCPEVPAFGFPSKYYFGGLPPGMTSISAAPAAP